MNFLTDNREQTSNSDYLPTIFIPIVNELALMIPDVGSFNPSVIIFLLLGVVHTLLFPAIRTGHSMTCTQPSGLRFVSFPSVVFRHFYISQFSLWKVLLGWLMETSFYLILAYISPYYYWILSAIFYSYTGQFYKYLPGRIDFIICVQVFYLLTGCACDYYKSLITLTRIFTSPRHLCSQMFPGLIYLDNANRFAVYMSKHGISELGYISTLFFMISRFKNHGVPELMAAIGNFLFHIKVDIPSVLQMALDNPFGQADDDSLYDVVFSFMESPLKHFRSLEKADKLLNITTRRFNQIVYGARRFVIKYILKRNPNDYDREFLYPEWHASHNNLILFSEFTNEEISSSELLFSKFQYEITKTARILLALGDTNLDSCFKDSHDAYKTLCSTSHSRFSSLSPTHNVPRMKPVCFALTGMSDTGKTSNIARSLCRILLKDEDYDFVLDTYQPQKKSTFWTSYSSITSKAVMLDDQDPLISAQIGKAEDHPWVQLMDLVNTSTVPIDKAAISEKGCKFRSNVIAITNNAPIDMKSFKDPDAVHNRVFQVEVIPKDRYMVFDKSLKLPQSKINYVYNDKRRMTITDRFVFQSSSTRKDLVSKSMATVNIPAYVDYINRVDEETNDMNGLIHRMDYCYYKVMPGVLAKYGKIGHHSLRVGDVLTARALVKLLQEDYDKNFQVFETRLHNHTLPPKRKALEERVSKKLIKDPKILTPDSLDSKETIVSHVKSEVFELWERTELNISLAFKIIVFLSCIYIIYYFIAEKVLKKKKPEEGENLMEFFKVPRAQENYPGSNRKFKPKKVQIQPPIHKLAHLPRAQSNNNTHIVHTYPGGGMECEELDLNSDDLDWEDMIGFNSSSPSIMLDKSHMQCNVEFRKKLVKKSLFMVYKMERDVKTCSAIAVCDSVITLPAHSYPMLRKTGFRLVNSLGDIIYVKPNESAEIYSESDMAFVQLLNLKRKFKNMIRHFPTLDEVSDLESCGPQLLIPDIIEESFALFIASLKTASFRAKPFQYTLQSPTDSEVLYLTSVPRSVYYSCTNAPGYCGSPVVGTAGRIAGKFLAFHIAGFDDKSYATVVTQDMVEAALDNVLPSAQGLFDMQSEQVIPVPTTRHSQLSKSHFAKAAAEVFEQKKFKPRTLPYFDEHGDVVDPAQSKLDQFTILEDNVLPNDVVDRVEADLVFDPVRSEEVLSLADATFGWGRMGSMDMSTAIGYFLTLADTREKVTEKKRKKYFMHRTPDGRIVIPSGNAIVRAEWDRRIEVLKTEPIITDYVASIKTNEPLKPGKDIRLFYAGCSITLLMVRVYFGTFMSRCMENRVDNEMAVGVNPYSSDWKDIIVHLTQFTDANYSDTDVSAMEYHMYYPQVIRSISNVIMNYYKNCPEEDNIIRRNLLASLFNCRVIWEGRAYSGMSFNPSGHPLTTIFNCLVLRWWKRYCFYTIYKERTGVLIGCPYDENVALIVMGDDSVEGISSMVKDWYTPGAAAEVASRHNVTVTTADKTTDFVFKDKLTDCDFLRRSFDVDDDGVPNPKLATTSIETSLFFCRGKNNREARQSTLDAALFEAHFHGPEYFDRVYQVAQKTKDYRKLSSLRVHNFKYWRQQRWEAYRLVGTGDPDEE